MKFNLEERTTEEAKETIHWLEIVEEANPDFGSRMKGLKQEAQELKNILSAIIVKTKV